MAGKQNRVVKLSINLPMSFPEDWTDELILFWLNESSSCCDNRIDNLQEYSSAHGCICSTTNSYLFPPHFDDFDDVHVPIDGEWKEVCESLRKEMWG